MDIIIQILNFCPYLTQHITDYPHLQTPICLIYNKIITIFLLHRIYTLFTKLYKRNVIHKQTKGTLGSDSVTGSKFHTNDRAGFHCKMIILEWSKRIKAMTLCTVRSPLLYSYTYLITDLTLP